MAKTNIGLAGKDDMVSFLKGNQDVYILTKSVEKNIKKNV